MKSFRRKNRITFLLILLLVITIGYAAISTQLKINGAVSVSKTTWDVHFENVQVTNGSVEANPAPTTNNTDTTTMTYTINFAKPGDYYEFTVDVVNKGTLDAMVTTVTNKPYTSNGKTEIALPSYLTSYVTYDDGTNIETKHELKHGETEKLKARIEFKKDISASDLPSSGNATVVFKFKGIYSQADETAVSRIPTIPSCPGCVFAYYTEGINYVDIYYDGSEPSLRTPLENYTRDYRTLKENGEQRKVFLGHILDNEDKVVRGFACKIEGNTPFCIEGGYFLGVDSDFDKLNAMFNRNKNVLVPIYGELDSTTNTGCNTDVIDIEGTLTCNDQNGEGSTYMYRGIASVYDSVSEHGCYVDYGGTMGCD